MNASAPRTIPGGLALACIPTSEEREAPWQLEADGSLSVDASRKSKTGQPRAEISGSSCHAAAFFAVPRTNWNPKDRKA